MANLLIADDNEKIASILEQYAKKEGYIVTKAFDGESALAAFSEKEFSMVLLDVMMPKKDGFEVCRAIRKTSQVPIIMITARGEDFERIMGLDIGADDYIVKPFSPGEVMVRVRAILRRANKEDAIESEKLSFDNLTVDLTSYDAILNEKEILLTKKEIELLWLFMSNPNRVFTRDNLLNKLLGYDYYGDNRTVDSHIKRLRAKLDQEPHPKWEIKTIWGVGYKFEVL